MYLENLKLITENCEIIPIDGNQVCAFNINDIRTYISRIASNAIEEITTAHTVFIEIAKTGDKNYNPFRLKYYSSTVFNRIEGYADITSIEFDLVEVKDIKNESFTNDIIGDNYYKSRKHYEYYVAWDDEDECGENKNQITWKSDLGNLYILITDNKDKINDYLSDEDKDRYNDKDYIEFAYDKCDIDKDQYRYFKETGG